jgi:hypothetical protein
MSAKQLPDYYSLRLSTNISMLTLICLLQPGELILLFEWSHEASNVSLGSVKLSTISQSYCARFVDIEHQDDFILPFANLEVSS